MPETEPASEFMRGCIYQKPMPQLQHSLLQAEITTAINQLAKPVKLWLWHSPSYTVALTSS